MQEIAPHVFIETSYAGVTLGAINYPHGLILVDAPFKADDVRSWRSALLNLGGGVDRILINLDAHFDRTLGTRAMECTVIGHEKTVQVIRSRPVTFKAQSAETGSVWELHNNLGSIRWVPPEISFTDRLSIHWNDAPLEIIHRPGPASGACWVVLPTQKVVFLGDAIVPEQPPFLANADVPVWISTLQQLLEPDYREYLLISGRGGLVHVDEVRRQIQYLQTVQRLVEELAESGGAPESTDTLVPDLLAPFRKPADLQQHFQNRLRYGLHQYYSRHLGKIAQEELVEE